VDRNPGVHRRGASAVARTVRVIVQTRIRSVEYEPGGVGPATQQSELPQNFRTPLEDEVIRPHRELPPGPEGGVIAGSSTGNHRLFRNSGDVWELAFDGKPVHVRHSKGMEYTMGPNKFTHRVWKKQLEHDMFFVAA
jgi:hypothetical protein